MLEPIEQVITTTRESKQKQCEAGAQQTDKCGICGKILPDLAGVR